ncbi:Glyoxalase/bleomycin resistance protein/dioxygenase [Xylanimonas cellulosilytica DSM 15894]|uniref:Glyoxalase/bleomycin resistance protein/dioxygenase n=1 Tax=Xylanimonas cellulosilytica (strain DSM 15894 / JCM 12276 / CECT 5975 / KCTC 9989 / LMG 20990 / NBRC 107835 / XIL07) TaxID=446471 RepID=D1BZC0_XYLCX|nr:VOC family protein [Xylanimonas cellulosilytica]ACZ32017.1 Glyoxalase/bleomycin resistance protein/dioxygenase [Xylanimonas cellulosilytica DSM 15894]
MANLVVHFEIHATEPERAAEFYSTLFGWKIERYGDLAYWLVDTGDGSIRNDTAQPGLGINGGIIQRTQQAPPVGGPVTGANLVIGVDHVDASFARALELGGMDAMAPTDMPGIGRLAYVLDPDNNIFGMISGTLSDGTDGMTGTGT